MVGHKRPPKYIYEGEYGRYKRPAKKQEHYTGHEPPYVDTVSTKPTEENSQ